MSHMMLLGVGEALGVDGPSADPSSASLSYYSGSLLRLTWTNGDATASTQIGWGTSSDEPASVTATSSPGITQYNTGVSGTISATSIATYPWVRHVKNSQYSDWVRSSNGYI